MEGREAIYHTISEQLKCGTIKEYKRLICFDHDVLASDSELNRAFSASEKAPGV